MNLKNIVEEFSLSDYPVALGGCRSDGTNFECCEYNITVFDEKNHESVHEIGGEIIKLHHAKFFETNSGILNQFQNLTIISDDQWKLRMFLSEIKEKRAKISNSYIQSCLVDAGVYATKAKDAVKTSDALAHLWLKCGACFLADAVLLLNSKRPSPTHMLELIRGFKKNKTNESFSIVHQCLGIERATTSLLSRMIKSTIGFSDIVESNGHSKIIQRKYDHLVHHSLLSDCYFYLCYTNRNNIIKVKDILHRNLEFMHILRVALDIENDPLAIDRQASNLLKTTNDLLSTIKS
ncbi:MAG TPA: hypothetical protein VLB45_06280 [Nitrosopumilaceae archaeon]|nr:hypothetical protein [Nitrosopumilaceae archaeon]